MRRPRVAIVSRDPALRMQAAAAFDSAPAHWDVSLHRDPPLEADVFVSGTDVACEGISFDPQHPSAVLDAVADRVESAGGIVAVTAASGGAGATSLALHLAGIWAAEHRVCLLDLSIDGGLASRLRIETPGYKTWADIDPGDPGSIRLAALPVEGGFRVLLAPSTPRGGDALHPARVAARSFDRVVVDVDLERGVDLPVAARVVVAQPTRPGALRAASALASLPPGPRALVLNRTGRGGEVTAAQLERLMNARVAIELPSCPALRDIESDGRLLRSGSTRWIRAVARLSRTLDAVLETP